MLPIYRNASHYNYNYIYNDAITGINKPKVSGLAFKGQREANTIAIITKKQKSSPALPMNFYILYIV
ncbi:hypothetical protein [Mucilaginibacter phyllosphaerae]|uniref:Uncharacterized protein n=1 Tax=Mucilaginibacter phyllosphaerae TaxID=1812349 RepID=A0A4Y8AJB1_9SPHI|nr:hypothetical protein [Mucilaginibacter phyllosphaerae]MBB3971361.1 hypothetical protein [Mucilaginibacter phyllosphaerae]TEW68589.1 hypothetical protein E2R65_00010 [Mucilaginibacter phyllosphaerae]